MSWRRLRTLLVREVRATLRDPFGVIVLVAVPLAALLTFSFVLSTDVKHVPLGVRDASDSPASRLLLADLAAGGTFDPHRYASESALEHGLVSGRITAGIVIPPDFEEALARREPGAAAPEVRVLYDGAETVLAGNADAALRGIVESRGARLVAREALRAEPGGERVALRAHALFNPRLEGTPFMVAGTFGFVLSFLTTLITAVAIVNERTAGTFDQLRLTPASGLEIVLGKLLPLGAVFVFDVVLMLVVAGLLLGVWPRGSVLLFVTVSAFYVLTSLALGLVFSATSETAAEAVQKTVLSSIPLVQLSGFVFPIRNMPHVIGWLAELLPATHYIRVSRAIYLRGEGALALLPELVLLAFFGVGLFVLALRTLEARS